MLLLKNSVYFSPKFPSEFFLKKLLPMSGVFWCMADENWFVFEFVCWVLGHFVGYFCVVNILKSFLFKLFLHKFTEKIPNGAVLLVQIFLKSLMMRIQTYFIDFQWWWKSFKMSKYWSYYSKWIITHILYLQRPKFAELYSINK